VECVGEEALNASTMGEVVRALQDASACLLVMDDAYGHAAEQ